MELSAKEFVERVKNRISAKDLELLGFSPAIVSAWKTRNALPRADDLYKIAQHLNVSMEWLLTGEIKSQEEIIQKSQEEILHKLQEEASLYKSKYENLVKQIQQVVASSVN